MIPPLSGQELEWAFGLDGFLDNREYYNSVQYPQTIFGSRAWFELGGSVDQVHRLRAGLNYMYEFGSHYDAIEPSPVLYYQLHYQPFEFYMGAFPRRNLLDYPLALLTDTLNYYRPNIEGIYFSYNYGPGFENIFIDWTSRQTDSDFERFMFGFSGRLNYKIFFTTHHFLMGHFARPAIPPPDFHIRDNGGFDVNVGVDLSDFTFFDTLNFSVGVLVSLDRIRNVYDGWDTPAGFIGQAKAGYKGLGICGTYYRGQGHEFLYGDSFYKAKSYGRIDFFWLPFRHKNVFTKIAFCIHFIEHSVDFSQQIIVSINLDGRRPIRSKD
jgi:hypothetical protein